MKTIFAAAVAGLAILSGSSAAASPAQVRALADQAAKLATQGKYAEGLAAAERAASMARSAKPVDREGLAIALDSACTNMAPLDFGKAVPICEENYNLRRELWGEADPRTLVSSQQMAQIRTVQGRLTEAVELWRVTVSGLEAAPKTPQVLTDLAEAHCNQGLTLFALGRWREYETEMRAGIAAFSAPGTEERLNSQAECRTWLADRLMRAGRYAEAETALRETIAFREARLPDHPNNADTLGVYGDLLLRMGRFDEAEAVLRRALAIAESTNPPLRPILGRALMNIGRIYMARGRPDLADPLFLRAAAIYESIGDPARQVSAGVYRELAKSAQIQGRYADAAAHAAKAYELVKAANVSPSDPAEVRLLQAEIGYAAGDAAAAEAKAREGLTAISEAFGADGPRAGAAKILLARGATARGDAVKAGELYAQAAANLEKAGVEDRSLAAARIGVAEATLAAGGDARSAWLAGRAGADLLTLRLLAEARAPGRSQDVSPERDRAAYQTALDAGWAYRESLAGR